MSSPHHKSSAALTACSMPSSSSSSTASSSGDDGDGDGTSRSASPSSSSSEMFSREREEGEEEADMEGTSPLTTSSPSPSPSSPRRTVGVRKLVFLAYFCVCGGAFGIEPMVAAGYPLLSLAGLPLAAVLWSVPVALMTAELASAIPQNGGRVLWSLRAFGPLWGGQCGWWTVVNGLVDNALYPVAFVSYLCRLMPGLLGELAVFPADEGFWLQRSVMLAVIALITALNLVGIELVGLLSTLFTVIVLSPFVVMGLWGLPALFSSSGVEMILTLPPSFQDLKLGTFLTVLLWNTSGWDSLGSIAGEVSFEGRPKALATASLWTILLVTLTYAWPLAVAICLFPDWASWEVGTFADAADALGGDGLRIYMTVCGLFSALGLFNVLLLTSSRAMYALGAEELLAVPRLYRLHPRFGTPWLAILLNSAGVCVFVLLPFEAIVEIDVFLYGMLMFIEFAALIRLRTLEPRLRRPYRVPCDGWKLVLFTLVPCTLVLVSLFFTTWLTVGLSVLLICLGMALGIWWHHRKWRRRLSLKDALLGRSQPYFNAGDDDDDAESIGMLSRATFEQHKSEHDELDRDSIEQIER